MVEDTKTLVAGAASSQEQLAKAAENAVTTIVQLSDVVKSGAASLGSNKSEGQVLLLNAVKDVASALGDLMQSTKAASGKSIQDPAMHHLKDSAKVGHTHKACRLCLTGLKNSTYNLSPTHVWTMFQGNMNSKLETFRRRNVLLWHLLFAISF